MSIWFNILKRKYDAGDMTKKGLKKAVKLTWITADEYQLITGRNLHGMRSNFECSHMTSGGICRRWLEPCRDKKDTCEAYGNCYDCLHCVYPASQEPCASCRNAALYRAHAAITQDCFACALQPA